MNLNIINEISISFNQLLQKLGSQIYTKQRFDKKINGEDLEIIQQQNQNFNNNLCFDLDNYKQQFQEKSNNNKQELKESHLITTA